MRGWAHILKSIKWFIIGRERELKIKMGKREGILGGEMESCYPTVRWGKWVIKYGHGDSYKCVSVWISGKTHAKVSTIVVPFYLCTF